MNRKTFCKTAGYGLATAAAFGITGCGTERINNPAKPPEIIRGTGNQKAVYVSKGKNRFAEELKIWGVIPLQIKVSGKDTNGANFIFEHANMGKGGPPRHFHYNQDEWFYALKGEFAIEVGDEKFLLKPGDSIFAPRMVPHVWAFVGDDVGSLLLSVQPAGYLEEFFMKTCQKTSPPTPEEAERLFASHGMKVVGPPLAP